MNSSSRIVTNTTLEIYLIYVLNLLSDFPRSNVLSSATLLIYLLLVLFVLYFLASICYTTSLLLLVLFAFSTFWLNLAWNHKSIVRSPILMDSILRYYEDTLIWDSCLSLVHVYKEVHEFRIFFFKLNISYMFRKVFIIFLKKNHFLNCFWENFLWKIYFWFLLF